MNNMIAIRADANEMIGTGHVMRCLSIAQKMRLIGNGVCFITADNCSRPMIENQGFEVICLDSVWDHLNSETDKLIEVIRFRNIKVILIDSYFVTFSYLSEIQKNTRVAYIDDVHEFAYPVDLLINYNVYADQIHYSSIYSGEGIPKFALGCKYAPLREEFCDVKKQINQAASKILITTGGTDRYNVTGALIECFKSKSDFLNYDFYFVLGRFNQNIDWLKEAYGEYKNIHFLINISDMDHYMKMCDIAITAGGTTTYELCACGIPSIMYTLADNQLEIAKAVSERNLIPLMGDVRKNLGECVENIHSQLRILCENYELRRNLSERMQMLCDGRGCERIVNLLNGLNS